jgi:hypothetical protein
MKIREKSPSKPKIPNTSKSELAFDSASAKCKDSVVHQQLRISRLLLLQRRSKHISKQLNKTLYRVSIFSAFKFWHGVLGNSWVGGGWSRARLGFATGAFDGQNKWSLDAFRDTVQG